MSLRLGLGLGSSARNQSAAGAAPSGFEDLFENTGPELDGTKWTENTRTGANTGVNLASNGLMQCERVSAGAIGEFCGFVTNLFENGSVDTIILSGVTIPTTSSRFNLFIKAANKTANSYDGSGNTGVAYTITLYNSVGTESHVRLMTDASITHTVGATFVMTGLGATPCDIKVVVTTTAGVSVKFELYVDNVLLHTRTDTEVARKEASGYNGITMVASTGISDHIEIGSFAVN